MVITNNRGFRLRLPLLQIWEQKQKKQQTPVKSAPIEGIKRINIAIVRSLVQDQQQVEFVPRQDLYAIENNCERNCYSYKGFGYLAQHYRNRKIIGKERRIKFGNNNSNNRHLKEKESCQSN